MRLAIKTSEVSKLLGVHILTVRNWIKQNRLKAKKAGRFYFINIEDLAEFLGTTVEKIKKEMEVK